MNLRYEKVYWWLLIIFIFVAFYFRFDPYFPNAIGCLGHDYSLFFPSLLDGVFWYKTNGIFEVPWFTPSFGGGLPKFPNPQSMYYSVSQVLFFFLDPILSVKITIFLFGFFGFYGFYVLLSKVFKTNTWVALLGGTLFLFNNFFFVRMIVGHLGYHSFMLFPFLSYCILFRCKTAIKNSIHLVVLGGVIVAYVIYSGGFQLLPIMFLGVLVIGVLLMLTNGDLTVTSFVIRFSTVIGVGLLFSAAQLNATLSYLSLFPRDFYPLPGYLSLNLIFVITLRSLFFGVPDGMANKYLNNRAFDFGVHEFDFGVTIVALLLVLMAFVYFFIKKYSIFFTARNIFLTAVFSMLMLVPLLLNYYSPAWNKFIKSIPFFGSSSILIRWISVYIPIVVVISALAVKYAVKSYWGSIVLVSCCVFLIVINSSISIDEAYYANENYDPTLIVEAHQLVLSGKINCEIKAIQQWVYCNENKYYTNDIFVKGVSQLRPYEPIFGYNLEQFPQNKLKVGDVFIDNGFNELNLKNPASYVFPKENGVSVGGHFKISQNAEALKFCKYQPFEFKMSTRQIVANSISVFSIIAFLFYWVFKLAFITYNYYKRKKSII